jgi:deoxyribose-phosphate aldolase
MKLASFIEHTILKADCNKEDVEKACNEALQNDFYSVCVPPYWVNHAANILEEKNPKIVTVIGYPMGYSATAAKVEEIKRAVDDGADEVDVLINICAVKEGNWSYVQNDINSVTTAAHLKGKIIKIVLETCLLSEEEINKACKICLKVKTDFVKTSSGKNGEGATLENITLLKKELGNKVKIQASGGIRTQEEVKAFLDAGAHRIGSSTGLDLV